MAPRVVWCVDAEGVWGEGRAMGGDVRGLMTGMLGAIGLCGIPRRRTTFGVFLQTEQHDVALC